MGLRFNTKGFVVRQESGTVSHDSRLSALTHKRVGQAGVLRAVPGTDVLYLRLHRKDKLSGQQTKALYQQARVWYENLIANMPIHDDNIPDADPAGDDNVPDVDPDGDESEVEV